ncbi:MAG TPA: hypothetical protein VKA30_04530 [Actinomycetota bacterium]|nr:hypothetical protein [Actinomycetota bacterium]
MLTADHLRRRWAGIASVLLASLLVAQILAALALQMKRHEAVLDRRGLRTTAVVVARDTRQRLPDTAKVRFAHDGKEYEADLTVNDVRDFPVGAHRDVVYDPLHPTHAKPVAGWSTTYDLVRILALVVLGVGVLHAFPRILTTVRLRSPATVATMRVESFRLTRWWQRWPHAWAALWPLDADPTSVNATLYVPIEDVSAKHAVGFEEPSTVLGDPTPGRLVLIVHRDRVVWPRGRARRDPPRGSDVAGRVRLADRWSRWP